MVVHSSICNPWFYPFFGTVAMAVGQIFGPALYPVMSNTGILLFIITLLALMAEVDKDIVATHDVACFLVQVAKKGDEISVTAQCRATQSVRQSYMDSVQQQNIHSFRPFSRQSFAEDEKTMESTDVTKHTSNVVHRLSTDVTEPTSNVHRPVGVTDGPEHPSDMHRSLGVTEDTTHSSMSCKVEKEVSNDEDPSNKIPEACGEVEEATSAQLADNSNTCSSLDSGNSKNKHSSAVTDEETGQPSCLGDREEQSLTKDIYPPLYIHAEDEARVVPDEHSSLIDVETGETQVVEVLGDSKLDLMDKATRKSPDSDTQTEAELAEEMNPPCSFYTNNEAEVVSDEHSLSSLIDEERGETSTIVETPSGSNVYVTMDEQTRKSPDSNSSRGAIDATTDNADVVNSCQAIVKEKENSGNGAVEQLGLL